MKRSFASWFGTVLLLACAMMLLCTFAVMASDAEDEKDAAKKRALEQESVQQLEDMRVTEKGGAPGLEISPSETVISVDTYTLVDAPGNIEDLLKSQAIIDFSGEVDLVPDEDTLTMRGFETSRFVTAVDGLTVQKTGGRKGSHIVDFSLLSSLDIDTIEIVAGPHSALYDSKSIGGAVNITTRAPKLRDTLKPDIKINSSYRSYNTQNHSMNMSGNAKILTYGAGLQSSSTDGYLRNTGTDIRTYSGNVGLILPYEGFVTFSGSYSIVDREVPVRNNSENEDYDPDDPELVASSWDGYQKPTWDKDAAKYSLNYQQDLPVGRVTLGAYKSKEDRDRAYSTWIDGDDHSLGLRRTHWVTTWRQEGGKVQDVYAWNDRNVSTIGYEKATLYDGSDEDKRVDKDAVFLQHKWRITPALEVKMGLRHEDVNIWVSSRGLWDSGDWIERQWDEWVPKTYTTYRMDGIAPWLRDTSLSLGISKIWHAPDSHGYYNPQGRPTGAWLEPEHGIGYDLVLTRRLWGDVSLMLDYAFYKIEDYMAHNSAYADYSGGGAGDLRYSDYMLNLEEMQRHGLELTAGGHLTTDLSFTLTYAWQDYNNQGDEICGKTAVDDKAKHTISTGLRYKLFRNTNLMLDYYYQSDKMQIVTEVMTDENGDIVVDEYGDEVYTWWREPNPAYQLVNFAVTQTLFKNWGGFKDASLKFYIKNLFEEDYKSRRGYPSTDRTFGLSLTLKL